jgi:hypothetical protein
VIETATTPESFFYEVLQDILKFKRINIDPTIEYYLVNILNQVTSSILDVTLVELQTEASKLKKVEAFRELGDTALVKSSIFREYNKVDISYLEHIGSQAYTTASILAYRQSNAALFFDLGNKFAAYSEILNKVTEEITIKSNDPLVLYEKYLKTKSEVILRKLNSLGMIINIIESEA